MNEPRIVSIDLTHLVEAGLREMRAQAGEADAGEDDAERSEPGLGGAVRRSRTP